MKKYTKVSEIKYNKFLSAIKYVLDREDGYNAKLDGGTYCGITKKWYPAWEGWNIVDKLKLRLGEVSSVLDDAVLDFYYFNFWIPMNGSEISDWKVGVYLLDWYVNSRSIAIKNIQEIVGVEMDGKVGPRTLFCINSFPRDLLGSLRKSRIDFYTRIGKGDNAKFLQGWLNRAENLYRELKLEI